MTKPEVAVYQDTVRISSPADRETEAGSRYQLWLSRLSARDLAQDLVLGHPGVRLHRADGTATHPIDGDEMEVLEVGSSLGYWLVVTVPPAGRPEEICRVALEELDKQDRWALAASLMAWPTPNSAM